jgi:hypothetical protein
MRCTKGTLDGFMCPPCAHKRYGRARLITGLKVAALAIGTIAVAIFALVVLGKGSEIKKVPPPKPRDPVPEIASLLDDRDNAPCDRRIIRFLVDRLAQHNRYAEVVDHASAYFAKCGPFPRLEWSVVYALQKLGRYAEAVKHETVLIEDDPFDSDFWWWRGEDRARSNQPVSALSDYRQSMAASATDRAGRFAAVRVLDVAGPASKPCEGVFAMRYFTDHLGGSIDDDLTRRTDGLRQAAACDTQDGEGTVTWTPSPEDATIRAEVTIGAATGRLVVDPRAGTTVVSRDFAARAQLVGSGQVETVANNVLRSGVLATAPLVVVGAARAAQVEVAIVDDLPAGVDGYLGLSFLWKFAFITIGDDVTVAESMPSSL